MSTTEFIASLVDSLAWPAAVVVALLVLRRQIQALLEDPISRLKAGPLELEWDRAVAETKKRVEVDAPTGGGPRATEVLSDLWDLADQSPATAVFEGYKRVEDALARRIGGSYEGKLPKGGPSELARLARDLDLITDETVRAVDGLAVLRDLAAHKPRRVTREEAGEYLSLVQAVIFSIATWLRPDRPPEDR